MTAPGSQPGVSIFEGKAMTTTIDEEKSQARAVLRFAASELSSRRAVEGYAAAIMNGEEGIMDHLCEVLDAVHTLKDELVAWHEGDVSSDGTRYRSRRLLAGVARMADEPTTEFADEEIYNGLDVFRLHYLQGNPSASRLVCCLVQSIHVLRDDLLSWGRDDRLPWERPRSGDH